MRVTQINVENAPTQTEELRYLSNPKFSKSILPRNPHGTHPQLSKKQVNWFSGSVGPWPILLKVLLWSWPGGEVNSEFTPSSDPLSTPYCPIHINPYCPLRPEPPNKFKLLGNYIFMVYREFILEGTHLTLRDSADWITKMVYSTYSPWIHQSWPSMPGRGNDGTRLARMAALPRWSSMPSRPVH